VIKSNMQHASTRTAVRIAVLHDGHGLRHYIADLRSQGGNKGGY
jgi:hypothetical protein